MGVGRDLGDRGEGNVQVATLSLCCRCEGSMSDALLQPRGGLQVQKRYYPFISAAPEWLAA